MGYPHFRYSHENPEKYDGQVSRIPKFCVSNNGDQDGLAYPKRGGDPQKRPGPRLGRKSRKGWGSSSSGFSWAIKSTLIN